MSGVSSPDTSRGTVPDRLLIVMREEKEFTEEVDGVLHKTKAREAFFTDADGKTDTAISWGTLRRPTGEKKESTWGGRPYMEDVYEAILPETVTVPNEPFTNIRLWTIDTRMEGGRAYKFIDEEGRMFDMREDTFLEAVFAGEVSQPGKTLYLVGQYIWVRAHSQMRVARVGSQIHEGLLEAKRRKELPKITGKMQVIGGVYKTKDDKLYVYVGRFRDSDKKLNWSYIQLREPYCYRDREKNLVERWRAMTIQEKFDRERKMRESSGCAENRASAMAVVEHLGTIDMGKDTAETLQWYPTTVIDGKVVRV